MNKPNTATLTLIRGLPGSGKSTLARKQAEQTGAIHLETDMYFVSADGQYNFDALKLKAAHLWCQQQTELKLKQGNSVIVSNTFVRHWEMSAYRAIVKKLKVTLDIQVCEGNFGSIHDISLDTINKMKAKWQK